MLFVSESLQDEHVLELSKRITSAEELHDFGIKCLGVQDFKVKTAMHDHKDRIQAASYELLSTWLKQQPSRQEAYVNLLEGLKRTQMKQLATELKSLVKGVSPEPYHVTLPKSQNYEESEFI